MMHKQILKGRVVLVKAMGGIPRVRRLWDLGKRVAYVCSEEQYRRLHSGLLAASPIGFPKGDVYIVAAQDAARYERDGKAEWDQLPSLANQ